jgi:hypothetical protein
MGARKFFICVLSYLFIFYFSVTCYGQSSQNYQLKSSNLASSAGVLNSTNFQLLRSNLGGFAIGIASSNNFLLNSGTLITGIKDTSLVKSLLPKFFQLKQNYPNPFNPTTTIEYYLPKRTEVIIKIYNSLGKVVRTLLREIQSAGNHKVIWDGTNDTGLQNSSGIYYYDVSTAGIHTVRKMILIK